MRYLIQLLLPRSRSGSPIASNEFQGVRDELKTQFGGVTVYSQMPAEGLWEPTAGVTERDEMVLFEVMTETIQRDWWDVYRRDLERRFEQEEIVVRAHPIERL